jgi:hypothetical protein
MTPSEFEDYLKAQARKSIADAADQLNAMDGIVVILRDALANAQAFEDDPMFYVKLSEDSAELSDAAFTFWQGLLLMGSKMAVLEDLQKRVD